MAAQRPDIKEVQRIVAKTSKMLAQGNTYIAIADKLGLSVSTLRRYQCVRT